MRLHIWSFVTSMEGEPPTEMRETTSTDNGCTLITGLRPHNTNLDRCSNEQTLNVHVNFYAELT